MKLIGSLLRWGVVMSIVMMMRLCDSIRSVVHQERYEIFHPIVSVSDDQHNRSAGIDVGAGRARIGGV